LTATFSNLPDESNDSFDTSLDEATTSALVEDTKAIEVGHENILSRGFEDLKTSSEGSLLKRFSRMQTSGEQNHI
jgi:hypothetical protein